MLRWFWRGFDLIRAAGRRRRWSSHLAAGRYGEDVAHRLLQRRGYVVVGRNYRTKSGSGEVDLIAWDGPTLVFVEVKLRTTDEFGAPERAVDREKQDRLLRAARNYAMRANVSWENVRFDIISIVQTHPPEITLLKDAFRLRVNVQ